jgi:prophage regulatory protein
VKLIRLPEVLSRVGLKKTKLYALIAEDEFPRPVKIGAASAWVESEVDHWLSERASARQATPTT